MIDISRKSRTIGEEEKKRKDGANDNRSKEGNIGRKRVEWSEWARMLKDNQAEWTIMSGPAKMALRQENYSV